MQTAHQENSQGNGLPKPFRKVTISKNILGVVFILLLVFSSLVTAQVKPLNDLRNVTKGINITVGSPIVNERTERALKVADNIPGLQTTIHRYNERFGNDSVRAVRFVDTEPDEKNTTDTLIYNYYNVVVVSDSAHQISRWFTFLVRKDYNLVLYYDLKNAKTAGINDWKKIWPASEFLRSGKE